MTDEEFDALWTSCEWREEIARLRKIEAAAKNLVAQKGRHHTEQAYQRLAALVVPNAKGEPGATKDD